MNYERELATPAGALGAADKSWPPMALLYVSGAVALLLLTPAVDAHGSLVSPPPRNAIDRDLPPWNGPVPARPPTVESKTGWCPVPDKEGKPSGQNGQACFWFSNGCAIGCKTCDGVSRGPIPWGSFKTSPYWDRKFNLCPIGAANSTQVAGKPTATICSRHLRTLNVNASCGAPDDWYYYSPWRAPGAAPVLDSCGMASGHLPPTPKQNFGGAYVNTSHAKVGDKGSGLPPAPSGTVWSPGMSYEVSWTIEANHGGGYTYRLAPANGTLDETSFNQLPLPFVGPQMLRWGGGTSKGGRQLSFNGTYVTGDAVVPPGSMWAKIPIPLVQEGVTQAYPMAPGCAELWGDRASAMCAGMGDGSSAVPTLEIVDRVRIPERTPPGEYVLNWRYDCEESNQVCGRYFLCVVGFLTGIHIYVKLTIVTRIREKLPW